MPHLVLCFTLAFCFLSIQSAYGFNVEADCVVNSLLKYEFIFNGPIKLNETQKLTIAIDFANCFWQWFKLDWTVDCSVHATVTQCLASMNHYQHQTFEYFYDHLDDTLILTKTYQLQLHALRGLKDAASAVESSLDSVKSTQNHIAVIERMQEELLNMTLPQFQLLASILHTNLKELTEPIVSTADMIELLAVNFRVVTDSSLRPFVDASVVAVIIGVTYSWFLFMMIFIPSLLLGTAVMYYNSLHIDSSVSLAQFIAPNHQYIVVSSFIWVCVIWHLSKGQTQPSTPKKSPPRHRPGLRR